MTVDDVTQKLLLGSTAFFLVVMFVEYFFRYFFEGRRLPRDGFSNFTLFIPFNYVTFGAGTAVVVAGLMTLSEWTSLHIALSWWTLPLYILAGEFIFYGNHAWSHNCRLLWSDHAIHHSSEEYDFTTNMRLTPFTILYKIPFFVVFTLLGFEPLALVAYSGVISSFQTFCHTDKFIHKDLGIIDYFICTPNNHAVHHASNPIYIDKNNGGLLCLFDHIFGTYKKLDLNEPPVFGVTTPINTHNPLKIIAKSGFVPLWQDLKEAEGWKLKLNILFRNPAWYSKYKEAKENSAMEQGLLS